MSPELVDALKEKDMARAERLLNEHPQFARVPDETKRLPLHWALEVCAPISLVRKLLELYPEACTRLSAEGCLPLHLAPQKSTSLDVLKLILENTDANGIYTADKDGRLPLHFALAKGAPLEVVKLLLDVHLPDVASFDFSTRTTDTSPPKTAEDALTHADSRGLLPLHWALRKGASLDVLKLLLDAYGDSAKQPDNDGELPLHWALAMDSSVDVVKLLLSAHVDAVKHMDRNGRLPLHWALDLGTSIEVLKLLVNANPGAMTHADKRGMLPLHWVVENGVSLDIVKLLIDANPAATKHADDDGMLPLNIALQRRAPMDMLKMLLDANPEAAKHKAGNSNLPLHWVLENGAPLDIVKMLLAAYADAAKHADRSGMLPLHIALEKGASLDVLKELLRANADAVMHADKRGKRPSDIDLEKGASLDVLKLLLSANTAAARLADSRGRLPLHLALEKGASLDALKLLLDAHGEAMRDAVKHADKRGMLPSHIALEKGATLDVMKLLLDANADAVTHKDVDGKLPLHWALDKKPVSAELIDFITTRCPSSIDMVDNNGRTPWNIALASGDQAIIDALKLVKYFMGRYELNEVAHRSKTCVVMLADDRQSKKRVALKFMCDRDQFDRERNFRRRQKIDTKFVVGIETCYDESCPPFLHAVWKRSYLHGMQYCLVMPQSNRGLQGALVNENFAGKDWHRSLMVANDITENMQHMHSRYMRYTNRMEYTRGIMHGGIKPLNVMFLDGRWRMIDLDCSCTIGHSFGKKKPSTAFCAPEMAKLLLDEKSPTEYVADASYDIWSFGVVLYHLCTGRSLWQCDQNDNLSREDLEKLAKWSREDVERRLKVLKDLEIAEIRAKNYPIAKRAKSAYDLIAWCLEPDPKDRPSLLAVRRHRLLTHGKGNLRSSTIVEMQSSLVKQVKKRGDALVKFVRDQDYTGMQNRAKVALKSTTETGSSVAYHGIEHGSYRMKSCLTSSLNYTLMAFHALEKVTGKIKCTKLRKIGQFALKATSDRCPRFVGVGIEQVGFGIEQGTYGVKYSVKAVRDLIKNARKIECNEIRQCIKKPDYESMHALLVVTAKQCLWFAKFSIRQGSHGLVLSLKGTKMLVKAARKIDCDKLRKSSMRQYARGRDYCVSVSAMVARAAEKASEKKKAATAAVTNPPAPAPSNADKKAPTESANGWVTLSNADDDLLKGMSVSSGTIGSPDAAPASFDPERSPDRKKESGSDANVAAPPASFDTPDRMSKKGSLNSVSSFDLAKSPLGKRIDSSDSLSSFDPEQSPDRLDKGKAKASAPSASSASAGPPMPSMRAESDDDRSPLPALEPASPEGSPLRVGIRGIIPRSPDPISFKLALND